MLTKQNLKEYALNEGIALFGVADIRPIKKNFILDKSIIKGLDRAVSIGYRLSGKILDLIPRQPTPLYYFHYQRANVLLDNTALKLTELIQRAGYSALPVPSSQIMDWVNMKGAVSHREVAELAGLGWRGRNNLTVSPECGAQVRYATILTDMPLETDKPLKYGCGACKECVKVCPAGAINTDPAKFDAAKCRAKLREFEKIQFIGTMICGVCVKACKGKQKERPHGL